MTTPQFEQAYKQLNEAQKEAVDTIEGPVMVVAGPGTGKTQILILRIANILASTQVNPENILALTFTESAAFSMRKRLVSLIGTPGYRVEINTFHGFCNEVIKRNPEDFAELIASENITEVEQVQVIESILGSLDLELIKPAGDPLYFSGSILSAINDLKKEGVSVEDFKKALEKKKTDFGQIKDLYHEKGKYDGQMKGKYLDLQRDIDKNEELIKVYERYQEELVIRKLYDFNDMLMKVITVLQKNKNLLIRLQETYQYILVDEHQDTNTAQNKLIELLASFYENPNLFVVGDEKQSIYRFQGASLENFLYFKQLYPNSSLIILEENYRSTQMVLNAAANLISQNITAKLLPNQSLLKSQSKDSEEKVKVVELSDYQVEYHFLAADIRQKIAQGIEPAQLAIFCRNNRDIHQIVDALEQYGISYVVESDQNVLIDSQIKKLLSIFDAVADLGSDVKIIKALHIDFLGIEPLDVYRLLHISTQVKKSVSDLLSTPDLLKKENFKNREKLISLWQKLVNWNRLSFNENLDKLFKDILNQSGFLEFILQKKNYLEILDKVTALFEEVKIKIDKSPKFSLIDFLNYLKLLEDHELPIKKVSRTTLKDGVRVMTAHRSKGLEFEYVYITLGFDGHWGNIRKRTKGFKIPWDSLGIKIENLEVDQNEDERRLFYVALTRAKRGVCITYSIRSLEGKEQIPSQFISEIGEEFSERVNISSFESNLLNNKETTFLPVVGYDPAKLEETKLLENKKFLQELFVEKGLSVTALNNFLECPWKYFYRNLLALPEAKENNQIFGSAVHFAINSYIRALKVARPTLALMVAAFKESLLKDMGQGKDFDRFFKRGEKALKVFFKEEAKSWDKNIFSELAIKGVKLSEHVSLNGKIDMVMPLLSSNEVSVYDFKTGRPKSRGEIEGSTKSSEGNYKSSLKVPYKQSLKFPAGNYKQSLKVSNGNYKQSLKFPNGNYKRQLVFYKILLDRYQQGKFRMKEGVISFVEPDEKGRYRKEIFPLPEVEVKVLLDQIFQVAENIYGLAFWNNFCDNPRCEYCSLRRVMS